MTKTLKSTLSKVQGACTHDCRNFCSHPINSRKLEQEILQWVADNLIGEDEELSNWDIPAFEEEYIITATTAQNQLKQEQRNKLKSLGWKG